MNSHRSSSHIALLLLSSLHRVQQTAGQYVHLWRSSTSFCRVSTMSFDDGPLTALSFIKSTWHLIFSSTSSARNLDMCCFKATTSDQWYLYNRFKRNQALRIKASPGIGAVNELNKPGSETISLHCPSTPFSDISMDEVFGWYCNFKKSGIDSKSESAWKSYSLCS